MRKRPGKKYITKLYELITEVQGVYTECLSDHEIQATAVVDCVRVFNVQACMQSVDEGLRGVREWPCCVFYVQ